MKDILKLMRFYFLTAWPMAWGATLLIFVISFALALFLAPGLTVYLIFMAALFVIPYQGVSEKSGFNKLYGILPVKRKTIYRARSLFIFLMHFSAEIAAFILAYIAWALNLNRLLPDSSAELIALTREEYSSAFLSGASSMIVVIVFAFLTLIFSYMEMMGQIFGRENEMKNILITMLVITAAAMAFFKLSEHDIIPTVKITEISLTVGEKLTVCAIVNAAILGICVLFGEITASKLSKREL